GDVNGDGYADILIGTNSGAAGSTVAYLVFGKAGTAVVNLSAIALGSGGFVVTTPNLVDTSTKGYSLTALGDMNGDGLADFMIGSPASASSQGVSYVVYGQTTTNTVNLSSIANGIGGFAINGTGSTDNIGTAVTATDVNGDGLIDLVVTAPATTVGGNASAGRAYVIFGGTQNITTTNIQGTGTVTGNEAGELIVGSSGANTLIGRGGNDRFSAGSGDDIMVLTASDVTNLSAAIGASGIKSYIDGGTGVDTIRLTGGANFDLTLMPTLALGAVNVKGIINSVERVDLSTDTASNVLTIGVRNIVDMSTKNVFNTGVSGWTVTGSVTGFGATVQRYQLLVNGSSNDSVDFDRVAWTKSSGSVSNGVVTYDVWNHNTVAAQLLLQQNMLINAPIINVIAGDDIINASEAAGVVLVSGNNINTATAVTLTIGGQTRSGVISSRNWSYALSASDISNLTQGVNTISVTQTDGSGVAGGAVTRVVTLDTVAPAAVTLSLASDTGSFATDGITNNPTINVNGLDSGSSWQYRLDGATVWVAGTGNSFVATSGAHNYTVRQLDVAGNPSSSTAANYNYLTVAPVPSLVLASDTGRSNADNITNNPTINVLGLLSIGSWEYQVDAGGSWLVGTGNSFTASSGSHVYAVRQTDVAGNVSVAYSSSTTNPITLDQAVPAEVTMNDIAGDNIISATEQNSVISGTFNLNNAVAVTLSLNGVVRSTVLQGTNWSYTLTSADVSALGQGPATFAARAVSVSGTTGPLLSRVVTVATALPNPPIINVVAGDNIINSAEQNSVITGTTVSGSTVSLNIGGTSRTATVTGTTWSYTLTAADISATGQGATVISATATDSNGNVSTPATRSVIVDTMISAPTINAITGDNIINALEAGNAINDVVNTTPSLVRITGTNKSGANVTLTLSNGATSNTRTATVTGTDWSYTLTKGDLNALGQGTGKTVSVSQTDLSGNTSVASTITTLAIDTIAPSSADLSASDGVQSIANLFINRQQAGAPVSLFTDIQLVTNTVVSGVTVADTDITRVSFRPTGTGDQIDRANDQLILGTNLSHGFASVLGNDSGTTMVGSGASAFSVAWRYDSNGDFQFTKADSTGFTPAQLLMLEQGLKFQTSASAAQGLRLFGLTHFDNAGNASTQSSLIVNVVTQVPSLDLDSSASLTRDFAQGNIHALVLQPTSGSSLYPYATITLNGAVSGSFTLESWVRLHSYPVAGEAAIINLNGGSNDELSLSVDRNGALVLLLSQNGQQKGKLYSSSGLLNLDSWVHVSATLGSDNQAILYVNGQEVQSAVLSTPDAQPYLISNAWIGKSFSRTAPYLDADVRDVRVYDAARTAALINNDLRGVVTSDTTTSLRAAYSFQTNIANAVDTNGTLTLSNDAVVKQQVFSLDNPFANVVVSSIGNVSITEVKIAVQGVLDGANENLSIAGVNQVRLDGTVSAGSFNLGADLWSWTYSGGTFSFSVNNNSRGASTEQVRKLIAALEYSDTAATPTLGNRELAITIVDAAGNVSLPARAIINSLPVSLTASLGTGVSDGATSAEATQASGVLTANASSGTTVNVTFSRTGGGTVPKSVSGTGVSTAITLTAADLTPLGDGTINVSAIAYDISNNVGTPFTSSFVLDTVAPTPSLYSTSLLESGSVNVASSEAGTAYLVNNSVTVTNIASITSANGASWNQVTLGAANTPVALSASGLGVGTYHLYVVDAAGNLSQPAANLVRIVSERAVSVAATDSSHTAKAGTLAVGDRLDFTVAMYDPVTVDTSSGTPFYVFSLGGVSRVATFDPDRTSASSLFFSYQIQAGDNTTAAAHVSAVAGALNVNGARITENAGAHNIAVTSTLALSDVATLQVTTTGADTTPPSVIGVVNTLGGRIINVSDSTITLTYNFSEAVNDLATSDFSVTNGTVTSVTSNGGGLSHAVTITPNAAATGQLVVTLAA
ncbi:MAG: Ig-like domain-containing protein, partial [Methylophilaceae bacterium]|nr:Ig-like domain-containing protein [Methylophilaceae bacterium]